MEEQIKILLDLIETLMLDRWRMIAINKKLEGSSGMGSATEEEFRANDEKISSLLNKLSSKREEGND